MANTESKIKKVLTPSDVVNNLTSTATDKPLSANMGKTLNDNVSSHLIKVQRKTGSITINANSYVELQLSTLGFTNPTGYIKASVLPSFSGTGTSSVIVANVSDVFLDYVTFKNLGSSRIAVDYAINVIYTPFGNIESL